MKKQNDKQKLFENLIKLNPELKNNTYLNEDVLNEVDDMQTFLSNLGFNDMYYQYKNDPQQLERIFTKILQGNNLKKFQKLLHPEGPAVAQKPTIDAFVQNLPDDFPRKMKAMIEKYGEDVIDGVIDMQLEEIGGEIGITNDAEAEAFKDMIGDNLNTFVTKINGRFGANAMGWGGKNVLNESTAPKLNEEFGAGTDDPTKEEMVGFLTQQFQGLIDPQEVNGNNFDMEAAIYWFANHYHGGQSSNLYSVLSTSDYHPSQLERSITDLESGTATDMYQELVSKYGGQLDPIDAGNTQWHGMEMNEKDDNWIQKAVDPAHKGDCTPMTKDTCTPARKAFAKRAKAGDLEENISIDVKVGDTIMTGRFKNSPTVVKSIGKDEHGMPTINGKKVVTFKKGIKDKSVNEKFEFQSSDVELKMKNGKTIPIKLQDHGRNIIVGDYTIDELLDSVGQEFAIGNFKQQTTLYQYFDYLRNRQGGATEETFNNNRLFRVNLEHAVDLFNRFSVEDGEGELMENNDGNTWENDIAPSNQEHFAKQAQGLGISPQEMYDEMKTQELEDDSRMQINEAELSREDMMAALKAKFGLRHVDTTENFYQDSTEDVAEGGIWLGGENGETAKDGKDLFDYYSTDYNKYELGVHNDLNNFLEANGWYAEWNDPGTLMVRSDSMEENKVNEKYDSRFDDEEDDPDAGQYVNGELLSPEEFRKWKEEEGEPDDRDAHERKYGRRPNW